MDSSLQQHLPFTVLKLFKFTTSVRHGHEVATAPTVYGIETIQNLSVSKSEPPVLQQHLPFTVLKRNIGSEITRLSYVLQQYLPFTVCAEGCEAAEEQSDDEVRTSQVPERSEGKTKVIRQ